MMVMKMGMVTSGEDLNHCVIELRHNMDRRERGKEFTPLKETKQRSLITEKHNSIVEKNVGKTKDLTRIMQLI